MTPLEQALADALKQAKPQQRQAPPVATAPAEPYFDLGPVLDYLAHLKREPREILEARYLHMMRVAPPKEARHDWLVARVAYGFQLEHYRASGYLKDGLRAPRCVVDRANDVARSYPGPLHECDKYDTDDPPDVEIWSDARVVAIAANPFERGASVLAFHAVEIAGAPGVAFEDLAKQIEAIHECSVGDAQDKALAFFTEYVRKGWCKVVIVKEDV